MANTQDQTIVQRRMEKAQKFLEIYMNDKPELNRLIRTKELSAENYELAIILTIDDYNVTAPITNVTLMSWPSLSLLLHGAAIQFLKQAGILQSRNRLNYSAGGISVVVSDKAQDYQSWIQFFVNDYETKKNNLKKFVNINGGMEGDGLSSEYSSLGGYNW